MAGASPANKFSRIPLEESNTGSWARYPILIPRRVTTCPVSEVSFPANIFNKVVLPVPFLATSAFFSPLAIPKFN